jgi:LPS export ABC transporter protein LptC
MMHTMKARITAALAAITLAACGGPTAPAAEGYEPLAADQVFIGVEHAITNAGVRTSLLKSDSTLMFEDSARVHLRGVNLDIFTETGELHATLTAETGELEQNSNLMVARGNVVLVIHGGANASTIRTEELHYDPERRLVWSDMHTERVMQDGRRNTMDSFRVDDQFGSFQASGLRGDAGAIRF